MTAESVSLRFFAFVINDLYYGFVRAQIPPSFMYQ